MGKVREEFLLSLIFVGKWIALGLGVVGILYVAIYLAYHKSYFDPRMEKFDLEVAELAEHKSQLEAARDSSESRYGTITEEISSIEQGELAQASSRIEKAKSRIEAIGLKWWEKIKIPLLKRNDQVAQAYEQLAKAEEAHSKATEKIQQLKDEKERAGSEASNLASEIEEYEEKIAEVKREKKRVEVDVKGPLLWLASILGLS